MVSDTVSFSPYGDGVLRLNRWRVVFADPMTAVPAGTYAEVFLRVELLSRRS
jgi:hypothetical protein